MDDQHARPAGSGFIAVVGSERHRGQLFIRTAHITAIRHIWRDDVLVGSDIYTLNGVCYRVTASFDQIADAIDAEGRADG